MERGGTGRGTKDGEVPVLITEGFRTNGSEAPYTAGVPGGCTVTSGASKTAGDRKPQSWTAVGTEKSELGVNGSRSWEPLGTIENKEEFNVVTVSPSELVSVVRESNEGMSL